MYFNDFTPSNTDGKGNLLMFENSTLSSSLINLEKGKYNLIIDANSLPDVPINGENAHLIIKVNGEEIGNYYLSEKTSNKRKILPFEFKLDKMAKFELVFDNDLSTDGFDRNIIIYSMMLNRKFKNFLK